MILAADCAETTWLVTFLQICVSLQVYGICKSNGFPLSPLTFFQNMNEISDFCFYLYNQWCEEQQFDG